MSIRIIAIAILAAPAVLLLLLQLFPNLILFALHQLYYAPLGSWIGLPFFRPDSEIVFEVLWPGRLLAIATYSGMIWLFWLARMKLFQSGDTK
jgi:hypothetical protein